MRYFPFKQAIRLPIFIKRGSAVHIERRGKIVIEGNVKTAMIRFGFHRVPVCNYNDRAQLHIESGTLVFKGTAHLGNGTKIYIRNNGKLVLDDNFEVSASSQFVCYHRIETGRDVQFAWDCLVMDTDTHAVYDTDRRLANPNKPVYIGDKVWVECRTLIMKGAAIPSNCVVGADCLLRGKDFQPNSVIAGRPAKSVKEISGWHL